ncbi:DUF1573 domain-containing protein [Parabacteroides bouchesdurhonensis]|uniref:DUF1573 domain-containing protein n=1 Tax=Parabacteroides bouchesdurhonensis TaxID=1936995 RepID=UPI000C84EF7A|nr:DUF1573 domain-containing protein [Parabacteroides bouchesdurhonensis]
MLNVKQIVFIFIGTVLFATAEAQNNAKINADELTYNFGNIAEADGLASHVFTIKNTGEGPLVITRVTASCGCTQPEWTKEPIAAGKSGEVKVTYNPKGRPGPFYKTISIFSNGKKGSYTLAIKGNVTPKPATPVFTFPYSIGDLKLTSKTILYNTVRPDEVLGEKISIINDGKTSLTVHIGKVPHYLTVETHPATLQPGETGEMTFLLDAQAAKKKGRLTTEVPVEVSAISQKEVSGKIQVAANLIDNFTKLSPSEKVMTPTAQLSGTLLDFGKLPEKGSFIPLIKAKVSGTFDITNTGKSTLIIYSASCDDERLDVSGGKKEIKPGETATFKVSLRPREIKTKLETLVNIVCNDPNGPVRLIKITAQK